VQVQYSLVSRGPQQQAIKSVCDDLGVKLISYSPLGLGLLTGKYDVEEGPLPAGPRSLLFRQILPGLQPLVAEMRRIADARKKSVPQVCTSSQPIFGFFEQLRMPSVSLKSRESGGRDMAHIFWPPVEPIFADSHSALHVS
jgi:hypothetical protein